MNTQNYASLEASKRLHDAGIKLVMQYFNNKIKGECNGRFRKYFTITQR